MVGAAAAAATARLLEGSVSSWHESANLSRAFSQFFWDLLLLTAKLSTDSATPAPKPDWDFLIFS